MTGARLLCAAALASAAAFAEDELGPSAASGPTFAAQAVSVQGAALSASFEGGKDGKKLTGKGAIAFPGRHFGGRVRADLSISAAEYDDQANAGRVLHAFDHDPGGTLGAGLTWDTFDVASYLPAAQKVRELCRQHTDPCDTREDLTPEERKLVDAVIPDAPTLVVSVRGEITTQYTKYFDPDQNKKLDDLAWPGGVSAGAGVFLSPRTLVAATGGWKLLRTVKPSVQLCRNLLIQGATASPPVLTCSATVVGAPSWKHELLGKFELRQYLSRNLGWNPSISFVGPVDHGVVSFGKSWRLEVPVYFTLSQLKDKSLTVGAGYAHWRDEDGTFDDVFVFLTGGFGLLDKK